MRLKILEGDIMKRKLLIIIILGLCLCSVASALPVITASISGNASGSRVQQYALNYVGGAGAESVSDVRQTISQSVTGSPGMVRSSAFNVADSLYGETRISQVIQSRADGTHLIQEQANIARISSGTGTSVTQQLIAAGNTANTPGTLLNQIQVNKVYWMNDATGSALQETIAQGTASFIERIQQNKEFWI